MITKKLPQFRGERTPFWRGGKNLEQSTVLTILGVVFGLAFVVQELMGGWRRAVPRLVGLAVLIAAIGWFLFKHR